MSDTNIVTSWYLLDDTDDDSYEYNVIKTTDSGALETVSRKESYYVFEQVDSGMYSVCVAVVRVSQGVESEQVCSSIVTVSSDDSGKFMGNFLSCRFRGSRLVKCA